MDVDDADRNWHFDGFRFRFHAMRQILGDRQQVHKLSPPGRRNVEPAGFQCATSGYTNAL
jgi:hypothetical protein